MTKSNDGDVCFFVPPHPLAFSGDQQQISVTDASVAKQFVAKVELGRAFLE